MLSLSGHMCIGARPVHVFNYAAPVWDACPQHGTTTMERFQLSIAILQQNSYRQLEVNVRCTTSMFWPPLANSGLASPLPKTVSAMGPSAQRWSSLSVQLSSFSCVFSLFFLFPQPFVTIYSVLPYFSSFKAGPP